MKAGSISLYPIVLNALSNSCALWLFSVAVPLTFGQVIHSVYSEILKNTALGHEKAYMLAFVDLKQGYLWRANEERVWDNDITQNHTG